MNKHPSLDHRHVMMALCRAMLAAPTGADMRTVADALLHADRHFLAVLDEFESRYADLPSGSGAKRIRPEALRPSSPSERPAPATVDGDTQRVTP